MLGAVIGIVFAGIIMLSLAKTAASADRRLEEIQRIKMKDNNVTGGI